MKLSDPFSLLPSLPQGAEILVARPRSLGDIVLETPGIAALHAWRPDLRIFALIEERFAPALQGNPAIAGLIFSRDFFKTIAEIRRRKFPLVFNQHGGPRSALLTAASGAKFRVGWKGFQYSFLYNVRVPDAAKFYGQPVVHTVEHRMSQFYSTGLPRGPIPPARVYPQSEAMDRVSNFLTSHRITEPYAVLQPESRTAEMRWPATRFSEIARWLRDTHGIASIVNLSGASAASSPADIRDTLIGTATIAESLPLADLISLIFRARLFIGNDSGPVHLAAACAIPSVIIYACTNPRQWRPWQSEHRVVSTGTKFRAIRGDKTIPVNKPRAISAITLEEVRSACDELLTPQSSHRSSESLQIVDHKKGN